jgi:hypothetical protein
MTNDTLADTQPTVSLSCHRAADNVTGLDGATDWAKEQLAESYGCFFAPSLQQAPVTRGDDTIADAKPAVSLSSDVAQDVAILDAAIGAPATDQLAATSAIAHDDDASPRPPGATIDDTLEDVEPAAESQSPCDRPWDVATLHAKTGAPTKQQLAEYLVSHAARSLLTKHKLQGALKSVLKNRKLKELHAAYEEFADTTTTTTPFAPTGDDAERAAAQQQTTIVDGPTSTSEGGDADGTGAGGKSKKKKKKSKANKKGGAACGGSGGGGVNSAVLPGGNGMAGTTPAPSLRLSGFTDS